MLETLKKLVGLDQESAEARKRAAEQEREERESRVAAQSEALKQVSEMEKDQR